MGRRDVMGLDGVRGQLASLTREAAPARRLRAQPRPRFRLTAAQVLQRRGRDSNSRYANQTHNGFRDRRTDSHGSPSALQGLAANIAALQARSQLHDRSETRSDQPSKTRGNARGNVNFKTAFRTLWITHEENTCVPEMITGSELAGTIRGDGPRIKDRHTVRFAG